MSSGWPVKRVADWSCQRTVAKEEASIGSGATLLGGTVAENAAVGADVVVTKAVPAKRCRGRKSRQNLENFISNDEDKSTVPRPKISPRASSR